MSRENICPRQKTAGNKMANIAVGNLQRKCGYKALIQTSNYTTTNYIAYFLLKLSGSSSHMVNSSFVSRK